MVLPPVGVATKSTPTVGLLIAHNVCGEVAPGAPGEVFTVTVTARRVGLSVQVPAVCEA